MTQQFKPLELTCDEAFYLTHALLLGQAIHEGSVAGFNEDEITFYIQQLDTAVANLRKTGGGPAMIAKLNKFFTQYAASEGKQQKSIAQILKEKNT